MDDFTHELSGRAGNGHATLFRPNSLWQAGQDPNLPAAVGAVLKLSVEQVEELLGKLDQG